MRHIDKSKQDIKTEREKEMKKNVKYRIISIILTAALISTSIPAMAFAVESESKSNEEIESVQNGETETLQEDIEQETDSENENVEGDSLDQDSEDETERNSSSQDVPDEALEEDSLENTLVLEGDVSEENAIEEESTEDMTVFDIGSGMKKAIFYGDSVRFEDENGNLVDYEPELIEITDEESQGEESLSGYSYENKAGDSKQYIPENLCEDTPLLLEKEEYQIKMTPVDQSIERADVNIKAEETLDAYEQIEEKNLIAEYAAEDSSRSYEYTSLSNGVKESIILNERPLSNEFEFSLVLKNLIPQADTDNNLILLKDKTSEEVVAVIDKPFMNDATESAYSEEIAYTLEETDKEDEYILKLTVDESYLDDESRVYPVTIDPTETWVGDSELRDVYVINGSYANINFYESSIRKMIAGKSDEGTSRTYIQFNNLKTFLSNKYVHSANFTLYEYSDCDANQTVRFNRVTEDWSRSTVTWNNKPAYYTDASINSFTTKGTTYSAHTVAMTTFVRNIVNGANTNYGIVMRNTSSTVKFASFYGSRTTATSYRPKLVVEYYDRPGTPTDLKTFRCKDSKYTESSYIPKGNYIYISWKGITSKNLSQVQYKIVAGDDATAQPNSVTTSNVDLTSYRSIGTAAATGTKVKVSYSCSLEPGKYKIYLKGKDAGGMYGDSTSKVIYVDGDTPSITNFTTNPVTSSSSPTTNLTPTISWKATDKYFSEVELYIDDVKKKETTTSGDGSYKVPSGVITKSGKHTIKIVAYDKAGKTTTLTKSYYVDIDAPVINTFTTTPKTSVSTPSNNARPNLQYAFDTGTASDLSKVEIFQGDTKLTTITNSATRSYQIPSGKLTSSGSYTFTIKAYDTAGNMTSKSTTYTFDNTAPAMSSIAISPTSAASNPSIKKTITITWNNSETYMDSVSYSFNGSSYTEVKPIPSGNKLTITRDFADGDNVIYLKVKDKAGNTSQVYQKHYYYRESTEYVPEITGIQELYGKRVLTFDIKAADSSKYTYELHRGTTSGFTPSATTRINANLDISEELFIDKEILNQGTYYYKIKTVAKGSNPLPDNPVSNVVSIANTVTEEEFANTLGNKDYLEYLEIGMPTGDISIEKSSGNLLFEQTDVEFSNPQLDYSMERTYQSKLTRTSMVGKGWVDSYHKEIYTKGNSIYFADSDGSCLKFEKQADNSYICAENKEYKLSATADGYEITDKDETVLRFNKYGQLVEAEEPNGCKLEYSYTEEKLTEVTSSAPELSNRSLTFIYGSNGLLREITDYAGTKYEYTYDSAKNLTKVTVSRESDSIEYIYSYGGTSGKLEGIYDGEGNLYSVSYSSGKASAVAYPDNEHFQITYGLQSTIVDRKTPTNQLMYSQTMTYDQSTGKVLTSQDAGGKVTTYSYQAANPLLVTSQSEVIGYETIENNQVVVHEETVASMTYEYTEDEDISSETDSEGNVTEYEYDQNGLLISETVTSDVQVLSSEEYEYDENSNISLEKDNITNTEETYEYSDSGQETSVTVEENGIITSETEYSYDTEGNLSETTVSSDAVVNCSEILYDEMGRETRSESNGVITDTEYDFLGRAVRITTTENGHAAVNTKVYNGNGTLISESTTDGTSSTYSYDSRNRNISQTVTGSDISARNTTKEYDYEPAGVNVNNGTGAVNSGFVYVETDTNAAGTETVRYINADGETVKELCGDIYTDYTYDASGNQIMQYTGNNTDSEHTLSAKVYDRNGNAIAEVNNPETTANALTIGDDTIVTYTEYDSQGNISSETDGNGNVTTYSYDEQNRLVSCDVAAGDDIENDIQVEYMTVTSSNDESEDENTDASFEGYITVVTDANGNIKKEFTNAAGLTTGIMDIDGSNSDNSITRTYTYDSLGRVTEETLGSTGAIRYTYEGDSERVATKTSVKDDESVEQTVSYTYDSKGRVTEAAVSKGDENVVTTSYTYDCEGRKLSESVRYGSDSEKTTSYSYTADGMLASVTYPSESGLGTVSYSYDSYGRISEICRGNDTVREYVYDNLGRTREIKDYVNPGQSTYISRDYMYNDLGMATGIEYTSSQNPSSILESYSYSYDKNQQITSVTRVNNLLNSDETIDETRNYVYDGYNRLLESEVIDNRNTHAESVTSYTYDSVGNRVQMDADGVTTSYEYNGLNQLTETECGNIQTVFTYDSIGNQILEENAETGATVENTYAVTGELLSTNISDGTATTYSQNNVYDHNGSRIARNDGSVTRNYYYSNGSVAYAKEDNAVAYANMLNLDGSVNGAYEGSDYRIYLKDMQGSTSSIVNQDMSIAAAYTYDDFGQTTELTGSTIENEICYTGALYDKETGLYYLNARYYDPEYARFISQDTYRGEPSDSGQWHLYAYCANNPINYYDPSGHFFIEIPFELGAVIAISIVVTSAYITATVSANSTNYIDFEFNFNKKNNDQYKVKCQIHKPDKYCKKSGIAAMKARWKDERARKGKKGEKASVLARFIKNHRWRYHGHIRIIKNGVTIKEVTI